MAIRPLLVSGFVLASASLLAAVRAKHLWEALPSNVDISAFYPVFDFANDVCYPDTAFNGWVSMFNANPHRNRGQPEDCRIPTFLDNSNTFHRHACVTGNDTTFCGHFFALHMLKNETFLNFQLATNRHSWMTAMVWTKNGDVKYAGYHTQQDRMSALPIETLPHENGHVKFLYYNDSTSTLALQFAEENVKPKNPYGKFVTPTIVSWKEMKYDAFHPFSVSNADIRSYLNKNNYGDVVFSEKDSVFLDNLNRFKPQTFPIFEQSSVGSP